MAPQELAIYVPKAGTWLGKTVAKGSAVVGIPREGVDPGKVVVYFEGNVYGAENLKRYAERCLHAAERGLRRYPTLAFSEAALDDLIPVGKFHYPEMVVELGNEQAFATLKDWCGWTVPVSSAELHA